MTGDWLYNAVGWFFEVFCLLTGLGMIASIAWMAWKVLKKEPEEDQ